MKKLLTIILAVTIVASTAIFGTGVGVSAETTNTTKYLYVKSTKGDNEQNFRFTFGEEGIPANATKFVIDTKGAGSTGLAMAFRNNVDASYANNVTSERIALNGTDNWVRNEVVLTDAHSIYHSLLVFVPRLAEINVDNVGFILDDGSFKAVQDYEADSFVVGTKDSGFYNINNPEGSVLAKYGFTGTLGWDFSGDFEIKQDASVGQYAVTIDGVSAGSTDGEFVLPESEAKGFIAYTDGTNYYDEKATITVTGDLALTTVAIGEVKMLSGASIRLNNQTGIRFETQVDATAIDTALANLPTGSTVEKGTLITLKDLATSDLTLDSTYTKVNVQFTSPNYYKDNTIAGSLVKIKAANIAKEFVGRGYVTVKIGEYTKTVYADYADGKIDNNSRSVAYIASVYKTNYSEEYAKKSDEIKALIDTWAAQYVAPSANNNIDFENGDMSIVTVSGTKTTASIIDKNGSKMLQVKESAYDNWDTSEYVRIAITASNATSITFDAFYDGYFSYKAHHGIEIDGVQYWIGPWDGDGKIAKTSQTLTIEAGMKFYKLGDKFKQAALSSITLTDENIKTIDAILVRSASAPDAQVVYVDNINIVE